MFNWYFVFLFFLVVLHLRISICTIYVHRHICHGSIDITPLAESIFKFLLWITGLYFDNFKILIRAQHLKHHQTSDTIHDPHSPHHLTIRQLMDFRHNEPGRPYYVSPEDIAKYSSKVKMNNTWLDLNIYTKYQERGIWLWIPVMIILFGPIGSLIGFVLLKHISEIHGLSLSYLLHKWGYRNKEREATPGDKSTNLFPIGIVFAGEELHNNHHLRPHSAKFSHRWYEMDIGFLYIKILSWFKLVKIKQT